MQKIRKGASLIVFLLLLYALLRLLFYVTYFRADSMLLKDRLMVVYWGLRIDFSSIFYANLVFFIYYFLLHDWLTAKWQKPVAVTLLSFINLPLLAVNMIDLAYYKFNFRRSTVDLFSTIPGSVQALGAFWKSWWYLFLLFVLLAVLSVVVFTRFVQNQPPRKSYFTGSLFPGCCFLLAAGVLARGMASRPIIPSTPLLNLPSQYQSLATNSTITILYSILKKQTTLKEKNYFSGANPDSLFTARQQLHPSTGFNKMNVVVFVLESFAKEYIEKKGPLHAQTPFLDSLMKESIVCSNAYANGLESNKGLVAILAGIPPFFDEPFYYSRYSSNNFRGIGTLLNEEGYNTNFFMGTSYDHFGFTRFSKMLGIEHYYSMEDYGDKRHYDGNWGIYDHYFLPYVARQLVKKPNPFLSVVFTVSTHFPYTLPDSLKSRFNIPGQRVEQNSMSYLDYSLRLFFDEIKKQPWYANTLFVFSADHNLYWHNSDKSSLYKVYRIPVFFHLPSQRKYKNISSTVQQMDIVPSVFDLLHYQHPFMSFGNSIFDTLSARGAIGNYGDIFQVIDSSYIFGYNGKTEAAAYLYNFRTDTSLENNLLVNGQLPDTNAVKLQQHLKAVMQQFNYRMIKNKLFVK